MATVARRAEGAKPAGPGLLALWSGILGPPAIWLVRLSASYALVPVACRTGSIWILNGITIAVLAVVLLTGSLAYRSWSAAAGDADRSPAARRSRFMGLIGMLSAALFFAVIVAEGLANLMIDPCLGAGAPL